MPLYFANRIIFWTLKVLQTTNLYIALFWCVKSPANNRISNILESKLWTPHFAQTKNLCIVCFGCLKSHSSNRILKILGSHLEPLRQIWTLENERHEFRALYFLRFRIGENDGCVKTATVCLLKCVPKSVTQFSADQDRGRTWLDQQSFYHQGQTTDERDNITLCILRTGAWNHVSFLFFSRFSLVIKRTADLATFNFAFFV